MTGDRLRELLAAANVDQREAAALLGYKSHNSLRQAMAGTITLAPDKAAWLERYLRFRAKQAQADAAWLEKNPPPQDK